MTTKQTQRDKWTQYHKQTNRRKQIKQLKKKINKKTKLDKCEYYDYDKFTILRPTEEAEWVNENVKHISCTANQDY